ncbi:MAG TPA: 50S ribosomal protein L11 methyltransferase [Candidatus Binataceae bacterium]|nr:50S ribosomal protein L11 methyltransferase [Candidatus Binataceae bacterium]
MARQRKYAKAVFRVSAAMADEAAGVLVSAGALGCAVAGMARPGAREAAAVELEAYFDSPNVPRIDQARRTLENIGMVARNGRAAVRTITDPGWATMWQWKFAPFRVGRRFLIVPPWDRRREPGRFSIAIEPGRAFGTGHHPSTAGALRAIERLAAGRPIGNALDVGTGSGILSFAMVHCGARRVVAIDVDSDALENARGNADQNGVTHAIRFSSVPLRSVRGRFDLITANILATVLIELAPQLKKRLAPRGRLVLGGVLARETAELGEHYRALGLRCLEHTTVRGWTTLVYAQ